MKSISSKILGRSSSYLFDIQNSSTSNLPHSNSISSISSVGAERTLNKKNTVFRNGKATFSLPECTSPNNMVTKMDLEFLEAGNRANLTPSIIGNASVQLLYFPGTMGPIELLPLSFEEFADGKQTVALHKKVWRDGYLNQLDYATLEYKRRFFKLCGNKLIGYHEKVLQI
jgi:hypothetical protein